MRFHKAYFYHHRNDKLWSNIVSWSVIYRAAVTDVQDELMDAAILCGHFKAPKFVICDKCNKRGHHVSNCPSESLWSSVTPTSLFVENSESVNNDKATLATNETASSKSDLVGKTIQNNKRKSRLFGLCDVLFIRR